MSAGSGGNYEFTKDQNEVLADLSGKMRLVGLVGMVIGVMNLLAALLLLVFIFQDRVPPEVTQKIPEDVRKQLPANNYLWGIVIQGATSGLIFLMLGVWTRSAAASFQQVVTTTGRDIGHLMNALGSLRQMYSLLYLLIVIALIMFLVGLGIQVFTRFAG